MADETLNARVLRPLARSDVMLVDGGVLTRSEHRHAGQFCPVVAGNRFGLPWNRWLACPLGFRIALSDANCELAGHAIGDPQPAETASLHSVRLIRWDELCVKTEDETGRGH